MPMEMPTSFGPHGAYRVVEEIGRGGFATVYKAYHDALDRYVAIKLLRPEILGNEQGRERFIREARIAARLGGHPNIVAIYDYGEQDGLAYLVLEYIDGTTLQKRLAEPISFAEIERIVGHWKRQGEPEIQEEFLEAVEPEEGSGKDKDDFDPDADDMLNEAIATVVQMGTASTSMLQRRLRVGYTRAGRLIDMMERRGVISGYQGSKAREVLITEADLPRVLAAMEEAPVAAGAPADD